MTAFDRRLVERQQDEHEERRACYDEGEKATHQSNRRGVCVFFH